jgi:RNA polymerase sigma-70 factor (ECF subfamily)
LLADAVEIALQVALDTLNPAERPAFVLHDMFAVPFDEIAAMVDRSPEATRQRASRARRRVRETAPPPDPDITRQRAVVDAYCAAAREGDLQALLVALDPDVVLRAHRRDGDPLELHGAERAGLTERTFFRHFSDKREVLFAGADALQELLVSTVANAPASLAPIDAAAAGLQAAGALIQEGGELA